MSNQKDSLEEKRLIPSADDIAKKVADKLVDPLADEVVGPVVKKVKGAMSEIIDSAVKPLLSPPIPAALKRFFDPGYINKIASKVIEAGNFDNIEALLNVPSAAKMESLPKHFLTDLLNSVDGFLDGLNLAANKAVEGGLPTIGIIKNAISSQKRLLGKIGDDIFALIKYPPGHIDFKKTIRMIDSHTAELKESLETPTVSGKSMSSDDKTTCIRLSIAGETLVCVADFLTWLGDSLPISVGMAVDVGVSLGGEAGVSLDLTVINLGTLLFGGVGMVFRDASEICGTVSSIIQLD
jgi:hypothetical protein